MTDRKGCYQTDRKGCYQTDRGAGFRVGGRRERSREPGVPPGAEEPVALRGTPETPNRPTSDQEVGTVLGTVCGSALIGFRESARRLRTEASQQPSGDSSAYRWEARLGNFLRKVARRTGRFPQLVDSRSGVNRRLSPLFCLLAAIRRPGKRSAPYRPSFVSVLTRRGPAPPSPSPMDERRRPADLPSQSRLCFGILSIP
jgi:hypothetical protein